ncbi:MAG: hypothetical protein ABI047_05355 [Jatrophihabitantaceae bacterium]
MSIETVDRDAGRTGETRRATVRRMATVAILAVLVVSALALHSVIESRHNRAPYAAAAVGASVRMEMVAPGRAQAVADRLAGPGRLIAPVVEPVEGQVTQQQVVGQLTFHTPDNAPRDGQYALFIIDRAQGEPAPAVYATGPIGTNVAQGWDGGYDEVAAKYPWLHMLASTRTPDGSGFTHSGMAVAFAPNAAGPVTFTAVLDPESLPVTDPLQQLTVALVFIGANDHIYWATKLAG